MSSAEFVVDIAGPSGARRVTLPSQGRIRIGRDDDADVVLPTMNVSRAHASVEHTIDGLVISDTSANGTSVDGALVHNGTSVVRSDRAFLQVGDFELRIAFALKSPPPKAARTTHTVEFRRRLHRQLLDHLDLARLDRTAAATATASATNAADLRNRVVAALQLIVAQASDEAGDQAERDRLVAELTDEALGLGPLENLLADPEVTEILVVDPRTIFVERRGKMTLTGLGFTDDDSVRAAIERIVTPLGRRIDESTPLVDARLKDGSRVNAVIPPLALRGPCITIRKYPASPLRMDDLVRLGSLTKEMALFLERSVRARKNIIISGGTGSGKTTLLNVLSGAIPEDERIVTVEDAAELRISQPHVVSLESRPANLEGKGEYTIRDLVKNALRMRPDRIVVGECRGGEALDMLQAMNTGHEGSLTTTHANTPRDATARIETLCLMAGLDLPIRAIRQQIVSSVHLIVQQSRFSDGSRRVTSVAEIVGIGDDGEIVLQEIFRYDVTGTLPDGKLQGEFSATGYLPSYLDQFITLGFIDPGGAVL